jgi:pimeloyl-ACP methyl ester carboxylesterase
MRAPGYVVKRLPSGRWTISHHINTITAFDDGPPISNYDRILTLSQLDMKFLKQRSDTAITTEDFFVPSDTAGLDLHLRRKRLAHVENFPSERTVLLMHGATFSSGSLFDAPVGGASFMDQLAAAGFDVYAVDVRGYGASTRPPEVAVAVDPSKQPVRIENWSFLRKIAGKRLTRLSSSSAKRCHHWHSTLTKKAYTASREKFSNG